MASEEARVVRFILCEQEGDISIAIQQYAHPVRMRSAITRLPAGRRICFRRRLDVLRPPSPGISKPERRQDMDFGRLRPAVRRVIRIKMSSGVALAYSTNTSKVAVVLEDSGVQQLIFDFLPRLRFLPVAEQIIVGIRRLRILVQILHVGMRRRGVQIEVILFNVLTVVAFAVGQAEEALFKDRVLAVPQASAKQSR